MDGTLPGQVAAFIIGVPRKAIEKLRKNPDSTEDEVIRTLVSPLESIRVLNRLKIPPTASSVAHLFPFSGNADTLGEPTLEGEEGTRFWLSETVRMTKINVEKLFGKFDYELPSPNQSVFEEVVIFYGDNGSGKTTLINLVFDLLSPSNDRGHRNAIGAVPFKRISVTLSNGAIVSATRKDSKDAPIAFSIQTGTRKPTINWQFTPKSALRKITPTLKRFLQLHSELLLEESLTEVLLKSKKDSKGEEQFLSYLSRLDISLFLVSADRKIISDAWDPGRADPSKSRQFTELLREGRLADAIAFARGMLLESALADAAKWISIKAVVGTNAGADSTNSVYVDVIANLLDAPVRAEHVGPEDSAALTVSLRSLSEQYKAYSEFEFTSTLQVEKIVDYIERASKTSHLDVIRPVIGAYMEGAEARLNALKPIYALTRKFIDSINEFFSFKKLLFGLTRGFIIEDSEGNTLEPTQLSSGEQHLLLLFCYTLMSRDRSNIFIIDEPEISLNIKWQRDLIQALLDISERGRVQFIFATHSIEFIAQNREAVAQLN